MADTPGIVGPPYWGVDCVAQADQPFGDSPTLYDYVLKHSNGRPPAFFGRYLTSAKYQRITSSEREFLRARNCRILLNYNQFYGSAVTGGRDAGIAHANAAAGLAATAGVQSAKFTPLVYIYANIDSCMQPSVDWITGWWDGLWDRGYAPGLYFPAAGSTLIGKAMKSCKIPDPEWWISIWSWSGQHKGSKNTSANQFTPIQPVGEPLAVDVWQYAIQCFPYQGDINRSFDMDLASEAGYVMMWRC